MTAGSMPARWRKPAPSTRLSRRCSPRYRAKSSSDPDRGPSSGKTTTLSADQVHVYQNVPVTLDDGKGENNGEPFLHAMWIGKAALAPV